MLIFHKKHETSNIFNGISKSNKRKNKSNVKSVRKDYKSVGNQKSTVIRAQALEHESRKKICKVRKKLSKKNERFLEGLGLKAKRQQRK